MSKDSIILEQPMDLTGAKRPRKSASKLKIVPDANTFKLGEREFKVVAFADRPDADGEKTYEDSSEFLLGALPIVMKLMNVQVTAAQYAGNIQGSPVAANGAIDPIAPEVSKREVVDLINELDIPDVIRELGTALPKLVAIVCRATDSEITTKDVLTLAKRPWNPNLVRAVVLQVKADNILEELAESYAAINEFGTLAAG